MLKKYHNIFNYSIYFIFLALAFASVPFIINDNSPSNTLNCFIWCLIISLSFMFCFAYNGYQITIGGLYVVISIFIFKWYYLPVIYVVAYNLHYLICKVKDSKSVESYQINLFGYSTATIVGVAINLLYVYFLDAKPFPLERSILIMVMLCFMEAMTSLVIISANYALDTETDFLKNVYEVTKEIFIVFAIDIPVILINILMYEQFQYIGLILSSSYIFVLQFAFTKEHVAKEATEKTYIDALTGVKNKKYYVEQIENEIDESCAFFMIDFNRFKTVNDTHGHDVGDKFLIHGSNILKKAVRDKDTVIRFGGDEFVLIIDNATRQICTDVIKRITELCDAELFRNEKIELKISMSIGISLCPEDGNNKQMLLNLADERLYIAKEKKDEHNVSFEFSSEIS